MLVVIVKVPFLQLCYFSCVPTRDKSHRCVCWHARGSQTKQNRRINPLLSHLQERCLV